MLTPTPFRRAACRNHTVRGQRGVVLMIALIILVALTLGGVALVRSVGTATIVAGNLAFQQAAVHASQAGIEDAITNMLEATLPANLQDNRYAEGYAASIPVAENPANVAAWDTFWRTTINPNPPARPVATRTCVDRSCTLPTDAAGNTVVYTIQRLCETTGDPLLTATGCASGAQQSTLVGGSLAAGTVQLQTIIQYYYRVTVRTDGPRNTVSYVQSIIAR